MDIEALSVTPQLLGQHFSQRFFPTFSGQGFGAIEGIVMIGASLALMFAGRRIIKILAFVVLGLILGGAGAILGAEYLGMGQFGVLLGGLAGFLVGGALSLLLLPLAIGAGLGLLVYDFTRSLGASFLISVFIGIGFVIAGIMLSSEILSAATAVFGGFLFFDALFLFGTPMLFAAILAVILASAGFWIQESEMGERKRTVTTAPITQTA